MSQNPWINHVKKYSKDHNISYREAMKKAKPSYKKKGKGIFSKILKSRPKNVNDFMKKNGHKRIIKLKICRKPIYKIVKKLMNIVTLGSLERERKKHHYDSIYHLYILIFFEDRSCIRMEKNEIGLITYNCDIKGGVCKTRMAPWEKPTFNETIEKCERSYKNFWQYSPWKDNCQLFIKTFVNNIGIRDLDDFILQDLEKAFRTDVKIWSKLVTNVGQLFQRIMGKGYAK